MEDQTPHEDPLLGIRLGGYTITRRLGRGGMAQVFVAHQDSVQRDVAIKVMHQDRTNVDTQAYNRFEREARIIANMEHAHILPVYDYGIEKGMSYLVMRLADGNLKEYLAENHPLTLTEVARFLTQIAAALDFAHRHQVIHRDLKPANILLDSEHNCLLADFGIAHLLDGSVAMTATGHVVGTLSYMAPEQIEGEAPSAATDIYALGIILYEILFGEHPFDGDTPGAIMHQHLHVLPKVPNHGRSDVPRACHEVIMRAMAKKPADRYPTAGAMAESFSEAIADTAESLSTRNVEETHTDLKVKPGSWRPDSSTDTMPTMVSDIYSVSGLLSRRVQDMSFLIWGAVAVLLLVIIAVASELPLSSSNNQDAQILNETGLAALVALDYDEAIRNFTEAIRLEPGFAAAHFNLGVAHEELGDLYAARTAYETALEHNDQLLLARYRLAEILLDMEEVEPAFQVIDIGIRMLQQGRIDLAPEDRDSIMFLLYTTRGRAYYLRGGSTMLALAEQDLLQALTVDTEAHYPAVAHFYLALTYEARGNMAFAQQAWLNVLATYDPNNARHREWAAQARAALSG